MPTTEIECERLILDSKHLPLHWNSAYAITDARRKAFLSSDTHSDSFFKPISETAMTVFMLGRLDGWQQAHLVANGQAGSTPRNKDDKWSNSFFKRFASPWQSLGRRSPLGSFLADQFDLDRDSTVDPFLLFEVRTFNNEFNGGKTIRNSSFLEVNGEWSRFDALVILPAARMLVFIESKVQSDGNHGAAGHAIPQPIRNLETAFFLTTLPDSQYCGWDFRYMLLCPDSEAGLSKECEHFFLGGHESALSEYDRHLSTAGVAVASHRTNYRSQWELLRQTLTKRLAVISWSSVMNRLCQIGFTPDSYLLELEAITNHNNALVPATKNRWKVAGIKLPCLTDSPTP